MAHSDPVTPELREAVFARDREAVMDQLGNDHLRSVWRNDHVVAFGGSIVEVGVCPAVIIDPNEFGRCWGRWTIDHIKKSPRLGRRAESTMGTLIALCEGHTEPGMKGGYQFNTSHRPEIRKYLEEVNK